MTNQLPTAEDHGTDAWVLLARTDREALGKLYDQLYPLVFRYCLRRVRERSLAEDITSSVFMNVARKIAVFPGVTYQEFRCWVFTIATNQINADYRKSSRRKTLLAAAAQSGMLSSEASDTESRAGDAAGVQLAIENLSERDQSIVTMRFYSELSYNDIAAVLDMSTGAVRTALSRAIDKIRHEVTNKS